MTAPAIVIESTRPAVPRAAWAWSLIMVTLAGLALRCFSVNVHSFWYDEAYTAALSQDSPHDLIVGKAKDAGNPPLYWIVASLWRQMFGDSELGLRSFSIIVGTMAISLVGVLGKRLMSPLAGLVAAGLMAVSPLAIELSNEARCYALMHTLVALNAIFFLRWTTRRLWLDWLGLSVTTFLACYCFYYAFAMPLAQGVALAASPRHRSLLGRWIAAMVLAGLPWLSWIGPFFAQLHQPGNLTRMEGSWATQFIVTPLAFALGRTFAWRDSSMIMLGLGMLVALVAFVLPASVALVHLGDRTLEKVFLYGWLLIPTIGPLLLALAGKPMYHHRAASVILPAFIVLVAGGLMRLKPAFRTILFVIIIGTTSVSLYGYATKPLKDDWRSATPAILAGYDHQTLVVFDQDIETLSFKYYLRGGRPMPQWMLGISDGIEKGGKIMGSMWRDGRRVDSSARDCTADILAAPKLCLALCVSNSSADEYKSLLGPHGFVETGHQAFKRIDIYFFVHKNSAATRND